MPVQVIKSRAFFGTTPYYDVLMRETNLEFIKAYTAGDVVGAERALRLLINLVPPRVVELDGREVNARAYLGELWRTYTEFRDKVREEVNRSVWDEDDAEGEAKILEALADVHAEVIKLLDSMNILMREHETKIPYYSSE